VKAFRSRAPFLRPRSLFRGELVACVAGGILLVSALGADAGKVEAAALHASVEAGDVARVQELITADPTCVHANDTSGRTPLHVAAAGGHAEIVTTLLQQHANEDARTARLETPLFVASRHGHAAVVRALIEHEAGVNLADGDGRTALYVAAAGGHQAVVDVLLENGAHPNATTAEGESALYAAVAGGYEGIVRSLLEMGSLSTFHTRAGETPLSLAKKKNDHVMVDLLTAAGARLPGERPGSEAMFGGKRTD
jgi:ankyrin repeat protein